MNQDKPSLHSTQPSRKRRGTISVGDEPDKEDPMPRPKKPFKGKQAAITNYVGATSGTLRSDPRELEFIEDKQKRTRGGRGIKLETKTSNLVNTITKCQVNGCGKTFWTAARMMEHMDKDHKLQDEPAADQNAEPHSSQDNDPKPGPSRPTCHQRNQDSTKAQLTKSTTGKTWFDVLRKTQTATVCSTKPSTDTQAEDTKVQEYDSKVPKKVSSNNQEEVILKIEQPKLTVKNISYSCPEVGCSKKSLFKFALIRHLKSDHNLKNAGECCYCNEIVGDTQIHSSTQHVEPDSDDESEPPEELEDTNLSKSDKFVDNQDKELLPDDAEEFVEPGPDNSYTCFQYCKRKFGDLHSFVDHCKNEHKYSDLGCCDRCNNKWVSSISQHIRNIHQGHTTCYFCNKEFQFFYQLNKHLLHHHKVLKGTFPPQRNLPYIPKQEDIESKYEKMGIGGVVGARVPQKQYVLLYDEANNHPSLVFEVLTSAMSKRLSQVNKSQITKDKNYYAQHKNAITRHEICKLGMVCGHLAAAANYHYDVKAHNATYTLANIVIMDAHFNLGPYAQNEDFLRSLTFHWDFVLITTIPCFNKNWTKRTVFGKNAPVPDTIFKIVVLEREGFGSEIQVYKFLTDDPDIRWHQFYNYRSNLAIVEEETGLAFSEDLKSLPYSWDPSKTVNSELVPVICRKCGKEIDKKDLAQHEQKCFFKCRQCKEPFATKLEISTHVREAHREGAKLFCEQCGEKVIFENILEEHKLIHSGIIAFGCSECEFKCATPDEANGHVHLFHDSKIAFIMDLNSKEKAAHVFPNPPTYYINIYEQAFGGNPSYKYEDTNEKSQTIYRCRICPESFGTTLSYYKHQTQHGSDETIKCPFCNYANSANMRQQTKVHLLAHKRNDQTAVNLTDKEFVRKTRFSCEFCPAVLKRRLDYDNHRRHHVEKFPYKCRFCNYSCNSPKSIGNHMKLHPNYKVQGPYVEKKLKCDKCPANFNGAMATISLRRHREQHGKNFKFKCGFNNCDFSSETKLGISRHQSCHGMDDWDIQFDADGQRTLHCRRCEYSHTRKLDIKIHVGRHGANKTFTCRFCDFSLDHLHIIRLHERLWHKNT